MNKLNLTFFILFLAVYSKAQLPSIQWQKSYGGSLSDGGQIVRQKNSGNYLIGGITSSNDGDVIGFHVNTQNFADQWVIEIDGSGNILWNKCYGGGDDDILRDLQLTSDGGFILVGNTGSDDGDVNGRHDGADIWVVKCDSFGQIQWQRCYGGTGDDLGQSIIVDEYGGYTIVGSTNSNDFDVSGIHYDVSCGFCMDVWMIRIDNSGAILWSKCYGGGWGDLGYSIIQTPDSSYVIAAVSRSDDGDVSGNKAGVSGSTYDYWIFKTDKTGNLVNQKCFGGSGNEWIGDPFKLSRTIDEKYILIGSSESNDSDLTNNFGFLDMWLFEIDSNLNFVHNKTFGGSLPDIGADGLQLPDSTFLILSYTLSNDYDITFNHGFAADVWLLRIDKTGNLLGQMCLGGTDVDQAYGIQQTLDSGFIISAFSGSNDGDVSGNHGSLDVWVIKLAPLIDLITTHLNPINDYTCKLNKVNRSATINFTLIKKKAPNSIYLTSRGEF